MPSAISASREAPRDRTRDACDGTHHYIVRTCESSGSAVHSARVMPLKKSSLGNPRKHIARLRSHATALVLVSVAVLCAVSLAGQTQAIDISRIGPRLGDRVPDFSGTDQFGRTHTLASSLAAKGAMLVFFRSADW